MPGSRRASDQTSKGEANIKAGNDNCTAKDTEFEPAERFEDVPVEDEECKFDVDVRDVSEPVRYVAQLERDIRLVITCEETAYFEPRITQSKAERHIPEVSAKTFIHNNCIRCSDWDGDTKVLRKPTQKKHNPVDQSAYQAKRTG